MIGTIEVCADADAVCRRVADWLIGRVAAAAAPVRVALSGGSTPQRLFARLAEPAVAARMDWQKLHLFWGDERCVPYDSADSNYGEARRLLLDQVPIPPAQVRPFAAEDEPEAAAAAYERMLQEQYGQPTLDPARPLFEVVLLGLGEDGHTASLIPGEPVLLERQRWAAVVGHGRPQVRLTLTYPVLQSARVAAFVVTGAGKAAMLARLRAGIADVPAARLVPLGQTVWFTDRAAWG